MATPEPGLAIFNDALPASYSTPGTKFIPECDFLPKLGPRIVRRIVYGGKVGHSGASVTLFFRSGRFWGFLPFPDSAMAAGFPDTPAVGLAVFVFESVALGL